LLDGLERQPQVAIGLKRIDEGVESIEPGIAAQFCIPRGANADQMDDVEARILALAPCGGPQGRCVADALDSAQGLGIGQILAGSQPPIAFKKGRGRFATSSIAALRASA
jgi:hypothetical protein